MGFRRARELGGYVVVSCNRASLVRTLRSTGSGRIVIMTETVEEPKPRSKSHPKLALQAKFSRPSVAAMPGTT